MAKVRAQFDAAGPLIGRPWPLHYRGDEPVNVAWFFAATVGIQWLILVAALGYFVDIYDLTQDCRHPVLKQTLSFGVDQPHEFFLWRDPKDARRFLKAHEPIRA